MVSASAAETTIRIFLDMVPRASLFGVCGRADREAGAAASYGRLTRIQTSVAAKAISPNVTAVAKFAAPSSERDRRDDDEHGEQEQEVALHRRASRAASRVGVSAPVVLATASSLTAARRPPSARSPRSPCSTTKSASAPARRAAARAGAEVERRAVRVERVDELVDPARAARPRRRRRPACRASPPSAAPRSGRAGRAARCRRGRPS